MNRFPQRTDAYSIRLPGGEEINLPSIDPQHLPFYQSRCGACGVAWSEQSLDTNIIERPFILPCDHLVGSRCLALMLDGVNPVCPTCSLDLRFREEVDALLQLAMAYTDDETEDDESVLSTAPSSPALAAEGRRLFPSSLLPEAMDIDVGTPMVQPNRPDFTVSRQKMCFSFLLNDYVAPSSSIPPQSFPTSVATSNNNPPAKHHASSSPAISVHTANVQRPIVNHVPRPLPDQANYTIQFTPINRPASETSTHLANNENHLIPNNDPAYQASASPENNAYGSVAGSGQSSRDSSTDDEDARLPLVQRRVRKALALPRVHSSRASSTDDEDPHLPLPPRRSQRVPTNELHTDDLPGATSDRRLPTSIVNAERRRSSRRSGAAPLYNGQYHPMDDFLSPER